MYEADPGQFGLCCLGEFDGRDRTTSWHRGPLLGDAPIMPLILRDPTLGWNVVYEHREQQLSVRVIRMMNDESPTRSIVRIWYIAPET